jgi:hypothetical protein
MDSAVVGSKPGRPAKKQGHIGGMDAEERARLFRASPTHISSYFEGVPVPVGIDLHSERYIEMCANTTICEATKIAYKAIARSGRFKVCCLESGIADDVRMVIGILRGIKRKCIPQEFSAGIMLMHLEILEGVPLLSET